MENRDRCPYYQNLCKVDKRLRHTLTVCNKRYDLCSRYTLIKSIEDEVQRGMRR